MAIAKYVKSTGERKRYQIDYTDWLDAGELLASAIFTVRVNTLIIPLVVDNVAVLPTGLGVQYYVSGGETGEKYEVVPKVTTNSSPPQIDEDEVLFVIREP